MNLPIHESPALRPSFDALGLCADILRAVREAGYDDPTPIQQKAIPTVLSGRDLVGCAQTGTGKTAAFALPLLQRLDETAGDKPELRALVITPTRELAAQIAESFTSYGRHLELWHAVIFGGVKDKPQIAELRRGVDALIATPGRLLDLMSRGEVDLRHIEILVLDEADRMLDMGFLPDVRRILQKLPSKRQTLFFSATMPKPVRALAETMLRDPVAINVAPVSAPADGIDQRVYFVDKPGKPQRLVELLQADGEAKTLVFSRTKHGANKIVRLLDRAGIEALAIHGNKSQGARVRALDAFRSGAMRVLVATDLAARGLDVEGVTHVINFDVPNVPETYVHRIGRTARAGATGLASSLCDHEERAFLADIEKLIRRRIDRPEGDASAPAPSAPTSPAPRPRRRRRPARRRR